MSEYAAVGSDLGLVSNQSNGLLLRSDLHTVFDTNRFTIVPKKEPGLSEPVLVVHAFDRIPDSELVRLYHNVPLQRLSGISMEFVYARFALTVFKLLKQWGFLLKDVERVLRVRSQGGYDTTTFSAAQCREIVQRSQSRSVSPRKRRQGEPGLVDSEGVRIGSKDLDLEDWEGVRDGSDNLDLEDSESFDDLYGEMNRRGRKMRRSSSMEAPYLTPETQTIPPPQKGPGVEHCFSLDRRLSQLEDTKPLTKKPAVRIYESSIVERDP